MRSNKTYQAFISYSHKDKPYATAIQKSIETLGLPFYKTWQPDVSIFRDERKIPLAGSLTEQIITGLKESEYLIVVASKNSANSNWVKEEILNWHKLNKDKDGFITNFNFILTDDVVEWDYLNHNFDKLKTTALPSFDERIFKEVPLWANLQQYCKDGKVQSSNSNYEWEIAKIKGLLLGKKPDEIIDEVSKGKRLFRIIAGVVISILMFLTAFAYYQREEAFTQRNVAETKTKEALSNLKKFKIEEFERNFKNGNTYLNAEEFCFANSCFLNAIATAKDTLYNSDIQIERISYLDSIAVICKNKSNCQ